MTRKLSTTEFVERARQIHGDKYDYSRVEYVNMSTKIIIGCKKHGWFEQKPTYHLDGCGCIYCSKTRKRNTTEFVALAQKKHGDKYDYSKVVYVNTKKKVCITCPSHGDYYQTPDLHLQGHGCPLCYNERRGRLHKMSKEDFIKKAKEKHGEVYDYSFVDYIDSHSKVKILCPTHGSFFTTPNFHLNGSGCPICSIEKMRDKFSIGTEAFKKMACSVHGDKYDYSKVVYENSKTKVCIICPIHGKFYQTAYNHLRGSGCPSCKESKGERRVANVLQDIGFEYVRQYKIRDTLFGDEVNYVIVDFYIPQKRMIIEYNGEQHYKEAFFNRFKDSRRNLREQQIRDSLLREYCETHQLKLIEIPYWEYSNIEFIIKKELED